MLIRAFTLVIALLIDLFGASAAGNELSLRQQLESWPRSRCRRATRLGRSHGRALTRARVIIARHTQVVYKQEYIVQDEGVSDQRGWAQKQPKRV